MPKTKGAFDEDVLLLYPNNYNEKFNRFTHCETPIVKGVICQLKRWPSDLFFAFLAACLIIASLIVLIFVAVAFCLPSIVDNKWRTAENLEVEESRNVYFLKLENHTWSTRELCYIETAARKYPKLHIYLINLRKNELPMERTNEKFRSSRISNSQFIYTIENTNNTSNLTSEEQLRRQLVTKNANVRNIDVSIERFFKGSKLSKIATGLSNEMLEFAAKAQLLWNTPGIVLNPNMYCNLENIEKYICNGRKQDCLPDTMATIEAKNNIQATGVPCQAFIGFLMRKISNNKVQQKYTLEEAVREYCPRQYYCPEVRIITLPPECSASELNCPIVYSTTISQYAAEVIKTIT